MSSSSNPIIEKGGNLELEHLAILSIIKLLVISIHTQQYKYNIHTLNMPRTEDPIATSNQYLPGDLLNPKSDQTISTHRSKGRNVSGRSWKLRPQKRASSLITKNKANGKSKSWSTKQQERTLNTEIKDAQSTLIQQRIEEKRLKRERRLENEKRRLENEYKHAKHSMQTLNAKRLGGTMKSMNKKQLRQIKKSRMNTKLGVVEFVGAYEK